jgi:NADH-quinone oxidoreductase subunit E
MLSESEKTEIQAELALYPTCRAVVAEALKIVQRREGWVTDAALQDVADFLGMTAEEVDGVATFYNLIFRRPVGRHVILICDSVSCHVMGYEGLRAHLTRKLGIAPGQTTPDGRFTLLPTACLGVCEQAPAMMVDQDVHGDLTEAKIDLVLASYA